MNMAKPNFGRIRGGSCVPETANVVQRRVMHDDSDWRDAKSQKISIGVATAPVCRKRLLMLRGGKPKSGSGGSVEKFVRRDGLCL